MQIKNLNIYFFIFALVSISALAFVLFKPFLTAIMVAVILAVTFRRPHRFFLRITGNRKSISAFLSIILVFLVIIIPVIFVSSLLVNEANEAYQKVSQERNFQSYINSTREVLSALPIIQLIDLDKVLSEEELASSLSNLSQSFIGIIQKTYQNVAKFILLIFVMFFSLYYFFIDGKNIAKKIMFMSPLRDRHENLLIERFVSMTRATLKGTLVIGLIQGFLGGILFALLGISSPIIWGVIMTILSIIPAIGPALVWFPAAVILFLAGQTFEAIVMFVAGAGIVSTIDNILRPKLVGRDTQMHPLLVFFATLGGIIAFGIMGFVIGPIIMALFLALWEIYAKEFKKQLTVFNK